MKRFIKPLTWAAAVAALSTGCAPARYNLPPEQRMLHPGPGVGGPGPGVLGPMPAAPSGAMMGGAMMGAAMGGAPCATPGGVMGGPMGGPAMGAIPAGTVTSNGTPATDASGGTIQQVSYDCTCGGGCGPGVGCLAKLRGLSQSNIPAGGGVIMAGGGIGSGVVGMPSTAQLTFGQPDGMQVAYDSTGGGLFDSQPLVVPARQNFPQGGLYRVKLTNIPLRPGVELYPTIELAYANPRTGAYLAHNSIPIQFTEEDFDQVLTGNFVTKVIYLPDPEFQGPALAGIDTLVSTRLDPGIDPIVEADRRGSILAIVRLGDKDIEMSGVGGEFASGGYIAPPIAGLPAPFAAAMTEGCGPGGSCGGGSGGSGCGCAGGACASAPPSLPGMVAGVTAPQYGMPISGTPIGLPGPPHIPLGVPAGLKKHVIKNHTHMRIPRPVEKMKMNVRLQPGYSYPNPVSRVNVREQNIHPGVPHARGLYQHASQSVDPNCQP